VQKFEFVVHAVTVNTNAKLTKLLKAAEACLLLLLGWKEIWKVAFGCFSIPIAAAAAASKQARGEHEGCRRKFNFDENHDGSGSEF